MSPPKRTRASESPGVSERMKEQARQLRRAERTEEVASWYFRLNGFLSIPGFIVHPDAVRRNPMTEADLIAVRFPYSTEIIADRRMEDDPRLTTLADPSQVLFLLVEVKTDLCNINGPWSNEEAGNMQRVIRRLGFAEEESVEKISSTMYQHLRWESDKHVLQYIAVGKRKNDGQQRNYRRLVQIVWPEISDFLFERFKAFPEKLSSDGRLIHEQWPAFGRFYGKAMRRIQSPKESREIVWSYIDQGLVGAKKRLSDLRK